MRRIYGKRSIVCSVIVGIITLLVVGSVSGWWIPKLKNPSGTYVGCVPGIPNPEYPEDTEKGYAYYTFVFIADRHVATRRMTMLLYWNSYQMYLAPDVAESRSLYVAEVVKVGGNTWKYRMLGYLRGPHDPEDPWMSNEIPWIIDDSGTITFSDDYQELTMEYNQAWYMGIQDVDPRDGFPDEGEPYGGYWPGTFGARRISVTE